MSTAEAKVLRFLASHAVGHYFNICEVWNFLVGKYPTDADLRAVPSDSTIRKYVRKHAQDLGNGQYRVRG